MAALHWKQRRTVGNSFIQHSHGLLGSMEAAGRANAALVSQCYEYYYYYYYCYYY